MATHQNNYSSTVAAPGSSAGATSTPITTLPSVAAPFYLVFDPDNTNGHYEVLYCTAKGGGAVTHAASTKTHSTGESVKMMIVAEELNAWYTDIDSIQALISAAHKTGSILFMSKVGTHSGFLYCDGSAVSRTTYAALFTVISTTYGVGDGSTTFNLPDLRGVNIVGKDSGDASYDVLGETGGAKTINIAHSHTMDTHSHNTGSGTASATGATVTADGSPIDTYTPVWNHTHSITTATIGNQSNAGTSTAGSATQSVMSKFLTLYPMIKT